MDLLISRIILIVTIAIVVAMPIDSYAIQVEANEDVELENDSLINLALEHHKWAVKHYNLSGMLDSAIVRTKMSLAIRQKLWKDNPNINLGKSFHNLGSFYGKKGEFKQAKKYLKEAVHVYTMLEHDRVLSSLLELGKIYQHEGDFVSAEDYYKRVINIAVEKKIEKRIRAAVVDLGSVYVDSFRDSLAILLMEKYMDYFDIHNPDDKNNKGRFYNNLANTYVRNDKVDEAISTYLKASKIDISNVKTQAQIYSNLGVQYRLKKSYSKSFEALKKGKELAYESQDLNVMSFNHKAMAKYYEAKSEYESALAEYQKAIVLMIPSFTPESNYENPSANDLNYIVNKVNLLSYFTDKVKVLVNLEKEDSSKEILELYKLGDMVIDALRRDHFIDDTKLYWRNIAFPFYEEALHYCHKEMAYEEAFYFFEKSKSVLLLEGYSFNESIAKTSKKDKDRYLKLKALLNQSKEKYNSELVENIVNSQRAFETFIDSLSTTYPHLFFKMQNDLFLLSLVEFQQREVKDSTAIFIHYFYGKDSIFAFGIESDKVAFLNLGNVQEFDSLILNLNQFFHHPAEIDNDFETYKMVSNKLYQKLLKPLIRDEHREVVVMPDGLIATIPFESLISNNTTGASPRYMIQDRVVRYSFSGSILNTINDAEFRGEYDVVTFVPFVQGDDDGGNNFSGVLKDAFSKATQGDFNIKEYIGPKASKGNLMSFDNRLPILHFSSHGFEDDGMEPEILLANSSLTLSDLYTSSLPADMVFLSACRTNTGENVFGEGIQSMARGFTFAGANSVISSLWNVIADPNSNIVRRFYENLTLGQAKHLALHNAKISYLEDSNVPMFEKSPYYWAGLIYFGEDDHVLKQSENKTNYLLNAFLFTTGLILIILGYRFNKSSKILN